MNAAAILEVTHRAVIRSAPRFDASITNLMQGGAATACGGHGEGSPRFIRGLSLSVAAASMSIKIEPTWANGLRCARPPPGVERR